MSDTAISFLRWCTIGIAALGFLQATILFEFFEERIFRPFFAMNERLGGTVPAFMRSRTVHRVWAALGVVVFSALWWFLGTPAGLAFLRKG